MTEKLNTWLQLGASVGILIGLILVGIQIQQATKIATAEMMGGAFETTIQSNEIIVGGNLSGAWSKAMVNSDELTDSDLTVISAYLQREWLNNVRTEMLSGLGFQDPAWDDTSTVRKWVFAMLGNETSIRWWRSRVGNPSRTSLAPEMRDRINLLLDAQGNEHHLFHQKTMAALRSTPLYP
jgi:hypothetical protein